MWSRAWLLDTTERLLRTFSQTFLAVWVPADLTPAAADLKTSLIAAGTAALLSLLMSLAATGVGNPASASLVRGVAPVGRHEKHWRVIVLGTAVLGVGLLFLVLAYLGRPIGDRNWF